MTGKHRAENREAEGRCPQCGSQLVIGTVDFAETPDVTENLDQEQVELQPGRMVEVATCPNPECPVREVDTGAQL
jgi:hypothetical protein